MNAPTQIQPPARLLAQARLFAQERKLPAIMADVLAARPQMTIKRMETLAPGLELIRDLTEKNKVAADDLAKAVKDYLAEIDTEQDPETDKVQQTARTVVFSMLADASVRDYGPTREFSTVGTDWNSGPGLHARVRDAVEARLDRSHTPTLGRDLAGDWGDIIMAICEGRGERVSSRTQAARLMSSGTHTASDFAMITADAMSNVVARQFAQRVPDLARASREIPRDTYHQGKALTLSASGMPQEIAEAGEIEFVTMDEKGEALPTPRDFGAGFNLTNTALVNDPTGLMQQASERMVRGAVERLRRVLLEPLEANAGAGQTMADGQPMFHTSHGNTTSTGAALSVTSLSEARVALRKAKGLQGELYAIEPWALVVPAELETVAQQVVAEIQATKFSDANPFSGKLEIIVEPGLADDGAWYLIGNPALHDGLAHAFLTGQSAPRVESRPAWETLGMQYRLVWAVDAKFIETAAWFRNPGA
ncbi:phage major capsid protein [Rhodobacter xanthinilyticus]|uniref:phage major capsid protein n=1 Tax=Rhodobacter xanthinilyticus TaxID=1850250 RepID=UPI0008386945|nr:Mu-like prophage major head subunit gpT family protein [Rhodobacter xanthinilyticus]